MFTFDYIKTTKKMSISATSAAEFNELREFFSVDVPGRSFMMRKRGFKGSINTRKYAISPTGICNLGMYWEIRNYFISQQKIDRVTTTEELKSALYIGTDKKTDVKLKLELRDYQMDVVARAMKLGWGTCVLGTGAGKTLTTAALIENYYRNATNPKTFKCIVLVPDLGLVNQTYEEFKDCGVSFSVSMWTGSKVPDLTANVIICNIGILLSRIAESKWVNYIDVLIIDECHRLKPDAKISKIVDKIKTRHKYGFTGTLPDNDTDKWFIIGKVGPVLYEKASVELRQENFLTNVEVHKLNLNYGRYEVPKITKNAYRNELECIASNTRRTEVISKLCNRLNNNTLILINQLSHGEFLHSSLTLSCPDKKVYFIRGDVEVEERDRIKAIMEERNDVICIAISAIFSTGVNIKNLHNIIFAAGGKSFIRTVQSIGRGLRLHASKSKLIIIDLCDVLKYGRSHGDSRMNIYRKEKITCTEKVIKLY